MKVKCDHRSKFDFFQASSFQLLKLQNSGDVHGTADSFSRREDPSTLNNRDLALSLDSINGNMGKMTSLLAKLCEKPAPKERPPGLIN